MTDAALAALIKAKYDALAVPGSAPIDAAIVLPLAESINAAVGGASANHSALTQLDYASAGHTGFQPALGYTAENEANKKTTLTDSDIDYPTTKAVNTGLNGKENVLGYTPEDEANKSTDTDLGTSDTLYPTQNAVKEYVDNAISGAGAVIAGSVIAWPGSSIPSGYLNCDGSAISRTTYADLFDKIGTTWGAGDGSTTFNIPDLRSATLRGVGTPTLYRSNTAITLAQTIDDAMQGHKHTDPTRGYITASAQIASTGTDPVEVNASTYTAKTYYATTMGNDGTNGAVTPGLETTGKARGVYWIIKY